MIFLALFAHVCQSIQTLTEGFFLKLKCILIIYQLKHKKRALQIMNMQVVVTESIVESHGNQEKEKTLCADALQQFI